MVGAAMEAMRTGNPSYHGQCGCSCLEKAERPVEKRGVARSCDAGSGASAVNLENARMTEKRPRRQSPGEGLGGAQPPWHSASRVALDGQHV